MRSLLLNGSFSIHVSLQVRCTLPTTVPVAAPSPSGRLNHIFEVSLTKPDVLFVSTPIPTGMAGPAFSTQHRAFSPHTGGHARASRFFTVPSKYLRLDKVSFSPRLLDCPYVGKIWHNLARPVRFKDRESSLFGFFLRTRGGFAAATLRACEGGGGSGTTH